MARTVFGLGEQVGCNEAGVGGVVGQHQGFTGPRQEVDRHVPEEEAFGRDDVGVAGTKNLVDRPDGLGAMHHRGDGLRAADPMDLGGTRDIGSEEQRWIDRAVLAARRAHHDLGTSRNLGQRDGHQCGRDQWGGAAWNIHADPLEGLEHLAHLGSMGVLGRPVPTARTFREGRDVLG